MINETQLTQPLSRATDEETELHAAIATKLVGQLKLITCYVIGYIEYASVCTPYPRINGR
jgi:hypothetical protein